jgi:hypothetical protein
LWSEEKCYFSLPNFSLLVCQKDLD